MSKFLHPSRLVILAGLATVMIILQIVSSLSYGALREWGIYPRHWSGLPGIVMAPWLHANWLHLWSNLAALLVLSLLTMWTSIKRFVLVSALIIGLGGVLVWLFGRNSIHIGSSGWIFGLWAWLLVLGICQRRLMNVFIAIVVVLFYGGLGWGLFPQTGVSVESHVTGAMIGGGLAWLSRDRQ